MSAPDAAIAAGADPAAAPEPAPVAPRPRGPLSLVVLAILAVGYTLWATQDLVLPVLLAMFFALVGNPIIRVLQRLRIPRFLGALAVLCGGIALAVLLAQQLVQGVAQAWQVRGHDGVGWRACGVGFKQKPSPAPIHTALAAIKN